MTRIVQVPCVLALGLLLGCTPSGDADAPAGTMDADTALEATLAGAEEEPAPQEEALSLARLGDFRSEGTGPSPGFRHDPHQDISCAACHPNPEGHVTHGTVRCADCHDAPGVTTTLPSRDECMECHHAPARERSCTACHEGPGGLPAAALRVRVDVAGVPSAEDPVRDLVFSHEPHADVECTECHTGGTLFSVERDCVSCHERHHRPDADCLSCHAPLPLETHDRGVHEGCSGSSCHTDPTVTALPPNRSLCLSCHQDLTDHEPGRECARCHQLGGT